MSTLGSKVRIDLGGVNLNNIGTFKKLNEVNLSARYSETFYKLDEAGDIQQLAYFNGVPVGGIKAKHLYKSAKDKLPVLVYILTIGVLEAYRHFGVGSKLLEFVEEETKKRYIHELAIHVQKSNTDLVAWWTLKGFEVMVEIPGYYKNQNLDEADAVYMSKKI